MGILDWLHTPSKSPPREGSSPATAIAVNAIDEEYAWIRQHCSGWRIGVQRCDEINGRSYDIITLRSDHGGGEREVYFDISSFMAPSPPAAGPEEISQTKVRRGTRDRKTLFPIQDAYDYLAKLRPEIERHEGSLRWTDQDGVTELRVEPTNHRTHDGLLVRELVTLTHTAPGLHSQPKLAAMLNRWSTLSALVPGSDGAPTRLVCKVGIFDGDRAAAERVYAPLLCTEAAIIGWHAARLVHGPLEMDPDLSPLTQVKEPAPYDAADFEAAKAITDRFGAFGTLSDSGLTVEFPWDDGAVSRMFALPDFRTKLLADGEHTEEQLDRMAGRTTLYQLVTDQLHSIYGNGVLARLELPIAFDEQTGPALIDELNRWELSGVDLPPLFGAWCLGPRAPTFVSFIPNQYCVGLPGLLQNLTVWAHGRHVRARHWLQASSTRN
jgi:hypothetical protein